MSNEFLDSNILVYAFSDDTKAPVAEALLARGCVTSVQGLNEFANVARRKLGMDWREVVEALASIRTLCRVISPLDLAIHDDGLRLADRYGLSFFDALMVASALRLDCGIFWSEDMQDGMIVEERMTIRDPFRVSLPSRTL